MAAAAVGERRRWRWREEEEGREGAGKSSESETLLAVGIRSCGHWERFGSGLEREKTWSGLCPLKC